MDGRTPAGDGSVDRSSGQPADAAPHSLDAPPPAGRRVELPPPPGPPRKPPRPSDAPRTQEQHRPVKFAPQFATESGTEPWVDLADNRPGEGTRHQAQVEREALSRRFTTVGAWTLRVLDARTEERAWRVGADAEEAIGKLLAKLAKRGYRAIHSIPVGQRGSDIDHLLIGPSGVYTINTKNHQGASVWVAGTTVKVNGHSHPYVRNSAFEARRVRRALSVQLGWEPPVLGVVAILTGTSPTKLAVKRQPDCGVVIVGRSDLKRWLRRRKAIMDTDEIADIFQVARRSTTWTP